MEYDGIYAELRCEWEEGYVLPVAIWATLDQNWDTEEADNDEVR